MLKKLTSTEFFKKSQRIPIEFQDHLVSPVGSENRKSNNHITQIFRNVQGKSGKPKKNYADDRKNMQGYKQNTVKSRVLTCLTNLKIGFLGEFKYEMCVKTRCGSIIRFQIRLHGTSTFPARMWEV